MRYPMGLTVAGLLFVLSACGGGEGADSNSTTVVVESDDASNADASDEASEKESDEAFADAGPGNNGDAGGPDASRSDSGDTAPGGLPVLGNADSDEEPVRVTTVLDANAGLDGPRDLAFNPESPDQLWIVNRNDNSTVVVSQMGTGDQSSTKYSGRNSKHFLANPAALAFGAPGTMATAQQENEKTQPQTPPDFMGVTLWSTDLSIFDAGHGGHLDMLHNSPLASGIAWEKENAYWVLDGSHGSLSRYDFKSDHGPGGTDHKDGVVRRYLDGKLSIEKGVVAHVALDRQNGLLYAADTGNQRILELDTETGDVGGPISPNYDGSDQKYVRDAEFRTLVDGENVELERPAGLELRDGTIFVTDNQTSTVHAFDTDGSSIDSLDLSEHIPEGGLQGMAFDEQGRLYVANGEANQILRIAPLTE